MVPKTQVSKSLSIFQAWLMVLWMFLFKVLQALLSSKCTEWKLLLITSHTITCSLRGRKMRFVKSCEIANLKKWMWSPCKVSERAKQTLRMISGSDE
jgi:hypothetical protein